MRVAPQDPRPSTVNAPDAPATLALDLEIQEIARLKDWLEAVGRERRLDPDLVDRLIFCSEELFTNVITHNRPSRGAVCVRLDVWGAEAALTVEDEGEPFDPTRVPPPPKPRSLEEAPIGGLGLHLVRQFSSAMEYQRLDGINRLVVRFALEANRTPSAS